ncbi:MAG: prolipoprotein diacylglyceryl transferase [Gammaproteobacteria bacterium]|nr:prolipoprotein diacylglyceryl transferase [Gammaproteobacteria bacterium]
MWHYPEINPIALSIGMVNIHWYGLSYLLGISLVWLNISYRNLSQNLPWTSDDINDIVFYAVLGVLIGGRVGYIFFYNVDYFMSDPLVIFRVWEGGMSFHGGFLGVLVSLGIFALVKKKEFFSVMDLIAPSIPIALCCGRLGNFINTELPGRIAEVPWAFIYPGETFGRHPSSLYQAILEGPVLFIILWSFAKKHPPVGAVSALFLICYGILRGFSEQFREPDQHIGFLINGTTMGQILSAPMVVLGFILIWTSYRRR